MQAAQIANRRAASGAALISKRNVSAKVGGFGMQPSGPAAAAGKLAVNHDPEDLFKGIPVKSGVIDRRMMTKQMEVDKEFAQAMASASDDLKKEQLLRRQARRPPANHLELVEYFLNTMTEDLEFEVARYRPRLTPDFFQYLDSVIGSERFAAEPDQDKLAELDLLRQYLSEAAEAVDKCIEATTSAKDRMMKLLQAKDKKQMILDMAADNEIDQALMDLLQQNIEAARAAGQEDPAKFMEKVKQACAKYVMVSAVAAQPALPSAPQQLGIKAETGNIPIIGAAVSGTTTTTTTTTPAAAPSSAAPSEKPSVIINPKNPSGMREAGKLIL